MTVNPQGLIYLCKTPLENDYKNQLTFANATAQLNYFNNKVVKTFDNYTYIRKDNTIKVGENIDEIINCNYLFYQNKGFTNKYYFCFITNMTYVNENCTLITIETDVYQTWLFSLIYKPCFVEREHVNNDTIGLHTVPEGLETGDFICNLADNITIGNGDLICCLCTDFPVLMEQYFKKSTYNSIYSGAKCVVFSTTQDASYFVTYMTAQNKANSIVSMFMLPNAVLAGDLTFFTKEFDLDPALFGVNKVNITYAPLDESTGATYMGQTTITNVSSLNGYVPKNNKLFTGQFNYFYLSNNSGIESMFHYEDFVNNTPTFELIGAFSQGGSIKLVPKNYLKYSDVNDSRYCFNYGISASKYPICSWTCDSYTMWLSENSLNLGLQKAGNIGSIIGGTTAMFIPGGQVIGAGLIAGGVSGTLNTMAEKWQHSRMSDVARGNTNVGEVQFASGKNCFTLFKMSVRSEYARCIDDFMSLYGYKVNEVKIPNITGRVNWNYVKTIDCNFEGDIPQEDLNKIRNMFNAGVTFWHNPNTMLDYSQSNTIVS